MSAAAVSRQPQPPWWQVPVPRWLRDALRPSYEVLELAGKADIVALVVDTGTAVRTLRLLAPGPDGAAFAVVPNVAAGPLVASALPHCSEIAASLQGHDARVVALVEGQLWVSRLRDGGFGDDCIAAAPDPVSASRARLSAVIEVLRERTDDAQLAACRHDLAGVAAASLSADDRALLGLLWLAAGDVEACLAAFSAQLTTARPGAASHEAFASPERAALAIVGHALLGARPRAVAAAQGQVGVVTSAGPAGPAHAAAVELVARQLTALKVDDDAARAWAAAADVAAPDLVAEFSLERARAEGRRGDRVAAALALQAALQAASQAAPADERSVRSDQPSFALRVARAGIELGAFELTEQTLATIADSDDEAALALAELWLWRGHWQQAVDRVATFAANHAAASLVRGIATLQGGDAGAALPLLAPAVAESRSRQTALVAQAEARLALGDFDGALADLERSLHDGNSVVAHAMLECVDASSIVADRPVHRRRLHSSEADGFATEQLHPLCAAAGITPPSDDPAARAEALRALLQAMGGNRTPRLTLRTGPDAALVAIDADNGRMAATAQLLQLSILPAADVLAGFSVIAERFPRSPHPYTYQGELRLWLGDLDGALADFRRAIARKPCRWGYVGSSAARMLRGQMLRARWHAHLGRRLFPELSTATTLVYRGELARQRRRWSAARADLETATQQKPSRIGAWMNLALTYDALGETAACDDVCARLQRLAPAIVWLASAQAGVAPTTTLRREQLHPICDAALAMMRGNRSSILHTLFVDGELRVIPSPATWQGHVRAWLPALSTLLRVRLVAGLGTQERPVSDDSW